MVLGLGAIGKKALGAGASLGVDRLLSKSEIPLPKPALRTYRADVVVSFLGVTIFSRANVGGGFAVIREAEGSGRRVTALHFAGGSNPDRAHGFRYEGAMEEVILAQDGAVAQVAYFGFVTPSRNESLDQARQRVLSREKNAGAYIAAEGLHTSGSAHCEKGLVTLSDAGQHGLAELGREVRARFYDTDRKTLELRTPDSAAPTTFLYTILSALRSGEPSVQLDYVHNAKPHRLELERASDPHFGATLASRRLTRYPNAVLRFTCRARDLSANQASVFRFWLDDQSELPLRIELQPRSYLRIGLELDGEQPNDKHTEET